MLGLHVALERARQISRAGAGCARAAGHWPRPTAARAEPARWPAAKVRPQARAEARARQGFARRPALQLARAHLPVHSRGGGTASPASPPINHAALRAAHGPPSARAHRRRKWRPRAPACDEAGPPVPSSISRPMGEPHRPAPWAPAKRRRLPIDSVDKSPANLAARPAHASHRQRWAILPPARISAI